MGKTQKHNLSFILNFLNWLNINIKTHYKIVINVYEFK